MSESDNLYKEATELVGISNIINSTCYMYEHLDKVPSWIIMVRPPTHSNNK